MWHRDILLKKYKFFCLMIYAGLYFYFFIRACLNLYLYSLLKLLVTKKKVLKLFTLYISNATILHPSQYHGAQ